MKTYEDNGQLNCFGPYTRHGMPKTSHKAAKRVRGVSTTQWRVLTLLEKNAMTDPQLTREFARLGWRSSESGIRSRRADMVRLGYVMALREFRGETGNLFTVWGLTDKGRLTAQEPR